MKNVKINHVRSLRQNTTDAEKHLGYFLRARRFNNYKFRRQHLVYPYVVDFICLRKGLIIECDGGQHQEQQEYDEKRHQFLVSRGYRVLRFWNNTILRETSMVLEMILEVLEATSYPYPFLHKKRGGRGNFY